MNLRLILRAGTLQYISIHFLSSLPALHQIITDVLQPCNVVLSDAYLTNKAFCSDGFTTVVYHFNNDPAAGYLGAPIICGASMSE